MLSERIRDIELRIAGACTRGGRSRDEVTLVAVTKTLPASIINDAIHAGLQDIGENRVQEYLSKRIDLAPHRFHMIGHLQRNKARQIIDVVSLLHSVDSLALAEELDRLAAARARTVEVLLEVNTSGEPSKFGVSPEDVPSLCRAIALLPRVRVRGLMTVAEFVADPETLRPAFRRMRELRDELARTYGDEIRELSMGMSNDFEVAIEEGATLIRLGSAIFGPRT